MDFNEYQKKARSTAIYKAEHMIIYPALKLAGEAGEVAEKVGKVLRDNDGNFANTETIESIEKELGDVLWYVANLSMDLGITLDEVAELNIKKLADRAERNKLQGSGDER